MSIASDYAISVQSVSKSFQLESGAGTQSASVKVVNNVSFRVAKGEGVAIVGRNGAGKSTLLRIICGIMQPDAGKVEVRGELFPVFGMQAGFNGDLTGLQNVLHKASLMGIDSIEERIDDIVRFANIGKYIDEPLRTYSNGMRGRLAFAVTFACDPEILVVDETLAAGDAAFHKKCIDRIGEIREAGSTVLLVSHGLPLVQRFCSRAILLDEGDLLMNDQPSVVNSRYTELLHADEEEVERLRAEMLECAAPLRDHDVHTPLPESVRISESFTRDADAALTNVSFEQKEGLPKTKEFHFDVVIKKEVANVKVDVRLLSDTGVILVDRETPLRRPETKLVRVGDQFHVRLEILDVLRAGSFVAETRVTADIEGTEIVLTRGEHKLEVVGNDLGDGYSPVEISTGCGSEFIAGKK